MSKRIIPPEQEQLKLWWVRRIDGSDGHLFTGDLKAAINHINALHLATGVQHAARDLGQD